MTSNAIGGNAPEASPAELDTKTKHARRLDGLLSERVGPVPVWIRAPKSGCEFYSGFSRAKLYQLADAGSIRNSKQTATMVPTMVLMVPPCRADAIPGMDAPGRML